MEECVNGEEARNAQLTVNTRPSVVAQACNPRTQEAGGGGRVPEFQASLSDTAKPCHKRKQNPTSLQQMNNTHKEQLGSWLGEN